MSLGSIYSAIYRDGSIGGTMVGASEDVNTIYDTAEFTTLYAVLHSELCKDIKLAIANGYLQRSGGKQRSGAIPDQYGLTELAKKHLVKDGAVQYKLLDVSMPQWKRDWYNNDFKV